MITHIVHIIIPIILGVIIGSILQFITKKEKKKYDTIKSC